ncbi:MAG: M23 family metallopeptidase [Clostridia bacterium]|nr:M23 family metallopeptidase [Clostridia bacterium]
MEQSKNKRANNMLKFVIVLCVIAVAVISVFTASSKREEKPLTDTVADTEQVSDTQKANVSVKEDESISDSAKKSEKDTEAAVVSDKPVTESEKKEETPKNEVKPTVIEEKESFDLPVVGAVTKEYSVDVPVFSVTMNDYRAHTGIDISCEEGSAVGAAASGVIKEIVSDPMMGTTVTIEHADGICSSYMNLNETLPSDITVGAVVEKGQLIGAVGSSAIIEVASEPHLHFEMTAAGAYVDPMTLLDASSISVMSENITE